VLNSISLIQDGLTWRIHDGNAVRIGVDPWIGCGNADKLLAEVIGLLSDQGYTHIGHIADPLNTYLFQQAWKSALDIQLPA